MARAVQGVWRTKAFSPFGLPISGGFTLKRTVSISILILGVLAVTGLPAQTLSVDKTSITFSAQFGGVKVAQTLNISSSSGSVGFFATSNTTNPNWLAVNPQTGSTPSAVTVTADP